MLPENVKKVLLRQRYKIVGNHSAAKLCLWTKKSIRTGGKEHCYKEQFYKDIGIKSHRCLQCTPSVSWCSLRCQFCWRATELTIGQKIEKEDEPEFIVNGLLNAQKQLLTGLGGTKHDEKYLKEAYEPGNVAISLSGEPTCYSKLSDLIKEFHKRNMKTFLVTNGTFPERLEALEMLPTQLYISLCSNSKEMMEKVQRPLIKDAWERLNKALELFPNFKTRKVVRLTMVRELNMKEPEKYAKLIEKALPNFVEIKSFMSVGFSRQRLPYSSMPSHEEIKNFSEKIAELIDYKIIDEKRDSRVVLLKK
ncbi:MAG: 4-demethylwyosine synthase TYW1 [Candidatus Aenigmatarchaeota archaeon]